MDVIVTKPTAWRCGRFYFDWKDNPTPVVMGILNITPDSFSDGGKYLSHQQAIDHAYQMIEDGAQIIDIGGESTRPGATPISAQEEQDRVLPVIKKLQSAGVALSIDTYKGETMRLALDMGIDILNDISGFQDPENISVAASSADVGLCIMHMQNTPQTMQVEPNYQHVVEDVGQFLAQKIDQLSRHGINRERIAIDPGFGFGKTAQHNLTLLHRLPQLQIDSSTLLVGLSRKKTLTKIVGNDAHSLTTASVVAAILAIERGAKVIRVHDVKPSVQAVKVWSAMHFEDLP
jgi:dihydropteroate synthase